LNNTAVWFDRQLARLMPSGRFRIKSGIRDQAAGWHIRHPGKVRIPYLAAIANLAKAYCRIATRSNQDTINQAGLSLRDMTGLIALE